MPRPSRSRSRRILLLVPLLLALLPIFSPRCSRARAPLAGDSSESMPANASAGRGTGAAAGPEMRSPASIEAPARVVAGSKFLANWIGPANAGDYLAIVRSSAPANSYENYGDTRLGASLELTAPIEPGEWEIRYVTAQSKTILARAALSVLPAGAVLVAADEVLLGAPVAITWTGPGNAGDFICIVPHGAPHSAVGNYADAAQGSPLHVAAPVEPGEVEIRYVSGQGRKVLARRKLTVLVPETSVTAAASVIAGAKFPVTWNGPANRGDYITVVPRGAPDGQYGNYADVSRGTPLELAAPIESGEAEIRYMTGKGARVLARRPISVIAAAIRLEAARQAAAGSTVGIVWEGPRNAHDYITIVPQTTPDGRYGNYADATKGSPVLIPAPSQPGLAEIRYMSGQGARVLARRSILITPDNAAGFGAIVD